MATEVLRFDDLRPFLLLRNGNFLYRLPLRDGWCVLKVYHGSRGVISTLGKSLENVCLAGQTSYLPGARRRTGDASRLSPGVEASSQPGPARERKQ